MSDTAVAAGQCLISLTPVGEATFSPEEEQAFSNVVERLRLDDQALASPAESVLSMQAESLPTQEEQRLLLDDFSVISHIDGVLGLEFYTSRAFVRAGQGDLVLGTFDEIEGYAEYMDERLGLGLAHYVPVPKVASEQPYAVCRAALAQEDVLKGLADRCATSQEPLWFHPYMGHADAWSLAEQLQDSVSRPIRVVAPTPVLCDRVNNKNWFLHAVRETLGAAYALALSDVTSARQAAEQLKRYAAMDDGSVTIKLADSASGMGTSVFRNADILAKSDEVLVQEMEAWIEEKGWTPDAPPMSVGPWHENFLGSPSVQLWIPPLSAGLPWVEGIYDQLFYPDDPFVFLGSVPSQLPMSVQDDLAQSGAALGRVFQQLGYVGRCSFDTILTGDSLTRESEVQVVYVECNGRWGGTSTPMTLLNRIFGDYRQRAYVANDFHDPRLAGMPFDAFVKMFDDILYDARTGEGWAIVYNVGCLGPSGKLDIIALGHEHAEAKERQAEFARLVDERAG